MESQKCKYPIIRERLRSLRMEKGLTQKEVADALFWSVSTIKQYESGNRKPDEEKSDNLKTLARFYDVFPEYILGEVPYRNEQERSSFYLKEIMDDPDMSQWIDEKIKFWKYAMTVGLNQSDYSENEKYGLSENSNDLNFDVHKIFNPIIKIWVRNISILFNSQCAISKISNLVIDAKFNGKTMNEVNCQICPKDAHNFRPEFSNFLVYAPGGYDEIIPGVTVFSKKLDLIWYIHNEKCLPDTNWDYSEPFEIPNLLKASSSSGFVYSQGEKIAIDSNYEIITKENLGAKNVVYPYGSHIEGFVYGDHPTDISKTAVFVNQRWAPYTSNLTVPAADLDITQYSKVCFFVRTKTFNKSFITIKDLTTNKDYSTLLYDCEVSDKWIKVEMEKNGENNWTVYIGKDKIGHTYTANYFKDIPLRFNDTKYYYSEMFGIKDPNVIPKQWVNLGTLANKVDGTALPTTNQVICTAVHSLSSSVVEGSGMSDIAKFNSQDLTQSKEFKFYARSATNDNNYFIISFNGSDSITNISHEPTQGLVSFKATTTEWTCFKFVVVGEKIEIYRNDELLTDQIDGKLEDFGIQLSGGKFFVTEMFCYK